jgi:hypothetical protein
MQVTIGPQVLIFHSAEWHFCGRPTCVVQNSMLHVGDAADRYEILCEDSDTLVTLPNHLYRRRVRCA